MSPPARQRSPRKNGASGQLIAGSPSEVHGTRYRYPAESPTLRFLAARELVAGDRCSMPLRDPAGAVDAIAEALGGRQLAGDYIRQMVDEVGPHLWPEGVADQ